MRIFKSSFLLLLMTSFSFLLHSQISSGTIKFKHTMYLDTENMPVDAPQSVDIYTKLTFNQNESLYDKDTDVKEDINPNDETPRMFRRMRERANRIIYKNKSSSLLLEQTSLFRKEFLISDSLVATKWKVSAGEQKNILGYTCMKAIYKDSTTNLVVFFAPQIVSTFGPDKYGDLPGMILEVQSAQTHIIATTVSQGEVSIAVPDKGDRVTRKQFNTIREEKMKEQKEMWGNRGTRIIRN